MYVFYAMSFPEKLNGWCYKLAEIPPKAKDFLDREAKGFLEYKFGLDYNYWTVGAKFRTIFREEC